MHFDPKTGVPRTRVICLCKLDRMDWLLVPNDFEGQLAGWLGKIQKRSFRSDQKGQVLKPAESGVYVGEVSGGAVLWGDVQSFDRP